MTNLAVWRVPGISTRPGLPKQARDPILRGANGGALFSFDLSFPWCYDALTSPTDAKVIKDMSETSDGQLVLRAGQSLANAGGGIDFSGVTNDGVILRGPFGCLAPLQADQEFAVLTWMKMPAAVDWNTGATIAPFFTASGANSYTAGPDLLTLCQKMTPSLSARRQTNGASTVAELEVSTLTGFYGRVTQVLYARTASATILQMRSSENILTVTGAAGALNSGNFSALAPRWGVVEAFNNLVDGSSFAQHRAAAKYCIYRGHIENLKASGRAPLALAAEDWDFVAGAGRYS